MVKVEPAWGVIEAESMPLADLLETVPNREKYLQKPVWHFDNLTKEQVVRYLKSCNLSTSQRRTLLNSKYWSSTTNGFKISPPQSLLLSLDSKSRQRIYTVLAKCGDNYLQMHPYRFNGEQFESALRESGVSRWSAERLRSLCYTNSGVVLFADQYAAQNVLRTNLFENFLKSISKLTPAYNLRLHVRPDSDLKALTRYWGKGGREDRIYPLLKALAILPQGGAINVGYLLPPFPRLRLYTYPYVWANPHSNDEDCFFSAFNFFSNEVNTNFYSVEYANKVVQSDYRIVNEKPSFGDLITLVDTHGDLIHVCVYIAEGYVFTKNGIGDAQPWVLMRLTDVSALYFGQENPGRTVVLRRKDLPDARRS